MPKVPGAAILSTDREPTFNPLSGSFLMLPMKGADNRGSAPGRSNQVKTVSLSYGSQVMYSKIAMFFASFIPGRFFSLTNRLI
jgi:hypothetical protein